MSARARQRSRLAVFSSLSGLLVETPARLASEVTGVHHRDQQRSRPILGVAEPFVKRPRHCQTHVQPDEVRQRLCWSPRHGSRWRTFAQEGVIRKLSSMFATMLENFRMGTAKDSVSAGT